MIDHEAVILDLENKREAIGNVIASLRELYGMPAANGHKDPPAPTKPAKPYRRRKPLPEEQTETSDTGRQSPLQDAIRKVLHERANRPMTSIEIFTEVNRSDYQTTSGSVYSTLRLMLSKGLIIKGKDEIGTTTWKLA